MPAVREENAVNQYSCLRSNSNRSPVPEGTMPESFSYRRSKLERVYCGQPAADCVKKEVDLIGARRVLLVSNQSLIREGTTLRRIVEMLGERCIQHSAGVHAHSPGSDIIGIVNAARQGAVDLLLAVGGGSVIDAAKIATVCLSEKITTLDALKARPPKAQDHSIWPEGVGTGAVRFIAVPTTLVAAEFSWGAGFTDENGLKRSFQHPLMAPIAVVLDPAVTILTPPKLFLSSGIRSVDHAAERLASLHGSPFSNAVATEALSLLSVGLPRVKSFPSDLDARSKVQIATWLSVAGEEAGAPTGASHVVGRLLSVYGGVPHGYTSCVLLPAVMTWNSFNNDLQQKKVSAALGRSESSAAEAIAGLVTELELPGRLRDLGGSQDIFPEIARLAFESPNLKANPRPVTSPADVLEILNLAW